MMASKKYDPLKDEARTDWPQPMKYYNRDIQKSAFVLPEFVKECLKGNYSFEIAEKRERERERERRCCNC